MTFNEWLIATGDRSPVVPAHTYKNISLDMYAPTRGYYIDSWREEPVYMRGLGYVRMKRIGGCKHWYTREVFRRYIQRFKLTLLEPKDVDQLRKIFHRKIRPSWHNFKFEDFAPRSYTERGTDGVFVAGEFIAFLDAERIKAVKKLFSYEQKIQKLA